MATVTFTSLKCVRKHDLSGNDEPEIWIGSRRIWSGVMNKNEVENVGVDEQFSNSVAVTMKERDGDLDDHKYCCSVPSPSRSTRAARPRSRRQALTTNSRTSFDPDKERRT